MDQLLSNSMNKCFTFDPIFKYDQKMTTSSCGNAKAESTSQKLEDGDMQEPRIERTDVSIESCLIVQSNPIFDDFDSESSSPTVQRCAAGHGKEPGRTLYGVTC